MVCTPLPRSLPSSGMSEEVRGRIVEKLLAVWHALFDSRDEATFSGTLASAGIQSDIVYHFKLPDADPMVPQNLSAMRSELGWTGPVIRSWTGHAELRAILRHSAWSVSRWSSLSISTRKARCD